MRLRKIMRKNMSWISKEKIKVFSSICAITIVLLTISNLLFAYYSPKFIKLLPTKIISKISPCYRTLYLHDGESLGYSNFLFGDSFTEGGGDEFLMSDPKFGIFNKLINTKSSELNFGRGGYGNIGTVVEFKECFPILLNYTTWKNKSIHQYDVTFVFYEGNDLNNNLVEEQIQINRLKYRIRFFLPIYDYIRLTLEDLFVMMDQLRSHSSETSNASKILPTTLSGIKIGKYPQAAAVELTDQEMLHSLNILQDSMINIQNSLPKALSYRFLYIPSVVSSYQFKGPIRVQSEKGENYFEINAKLSTLNSKKIRAAAHGFSKKLGWGFCDTTSNLTKQSDKGIPLHGPRDWNHFNKKGYSVVSQTYESCFK